MGILKTLTVNGTTYNVTPVVPANSITLLATAWTGNGGSYSQVVEIPGVTAHTKVDLQLTSEQHREFLDKVLTFVAENDWGVVTVYAIGDKPTGDHTIQTTLTEVDTVGKIRGNTVGTPLPRTDFNQVDPNRADYLRGREKIVQTVNGTAPDENGDVEVEGSVTANQIAAAVEAYLKDNPVEGGGEPGYSPTVTVTQTGSGAVIAIIDKNGTTTATIAHGKNGEPGKTPVKGEDYFTPEEIQDIAEQAAGLVEVPSDIVRYTEQTLTPEQQAQARENIGAVSMEDVENLLNPDPVTNVNIFDDLFTVNVGCLAGYSTTTYDVDPITSTKYQNHRWAEYVIDDSVDEIRISLPSSTITGLALLVTNLKNTAFPYPYSELANGSDKCEFVEAVAGEDHYTVNVAACRAAGYKKIAIGYLGTDEIVVYDNETYQEETNEPEEIPGALMCSVNMFNSIGAIGDSYTSANTMHSDSTWTKQREQSYVATIAKRAGIDWANFGVPGATTRSYLTASDGLNAVLAAEANDFYFLALGINDASLGSGYVGTIADITDNYANNPDTFYGNYAKIIERVMNHAPNAKFCIIKIPLKGNTYSAFSDAIEAIANHYGIPCIDPFNDPFFTSEMYTAQSGSHPTCGGYVGMGLAYERLLSKVMLENVEYFRYATVG